MNIDELNKDELLKLIKAYNKYIIGKCDDKQNVINNCPVCINEFLDNEFAKMNEDVSDYVVNFNVFTSRTIEAVSIDDAREKFMELTRSQLMRDIEYEISIGGLEVGTIEKVELDRI